MKRLLPIVLFGALTGMATLLAGAVNALIAWMVTLPEGAEIVEPGAVVEDDAGAGGPVAAADRDADDAERPRAQAATRKQYIDGILRRNIFDSTAIGKTSAGGGGEVSSLNVRLVTTLVADPPEYSSALIAEEGADGRVTGYGIGDKLGDAEIVAIEQKRVQIKRDGKLEWIVMDGKTAERAGPGDAAPAEGGDEGIRKIDDTHYAVDRSVVDKYLTDLEGLSKMARAIPHRGPDGEIDGYRLSGIRRNSPLSQLGIRNGDVVKSVNGHSLSSMQDAMGAFNSLQSASSLTFQISRRGQDMTMEYNIQ